jgi:hypothetical protein
LRLPAAPSLRFSPSSRVLPSYTYPAAAATKSSHGLPLPSALKESEVHFTRVRPPATVRLQGLATLLTAYSLESRAGFVSHRQRSWDSPFGEFPSRKVSTAFRPGRTHIPFSLAVIPPPKRRTGPTGLGSWVHASRECLATGRVFNPPTAGVSLGVRPSRACSRRPWPGLLQASSHALRESWRLLPGFAGAPESRSAFASPRPTHTEVHAGQSNPSGVPAPARS